MTTIHIRYKSSLRPAIVFCGDSVHRVVCGFSVTRAMDNSWHAFEIKAVLGTFAHSQLFTDEFRLAVQAIRDMRCHVSY